MIIDMKYYYMITHDIHEAKTYLFVQKSSSKKHDNVSQTRRYRNVSTPTSRSISPRHPPSQRLWKISRKWTTTRTRLSNSPRSGKTLSLTFIHNMFTPFHIQDTIRNTKFLALYHWWLSTQFPPRKAYQIAKAKTMKEYPIKQWEPLYPMTHTNIWNSSPSSSSHSSPSTSSHTSTHHTT